jgi:NAD(P)-dependent dehydrogenase (short-subunit alcohol dehydrogenase family)
MKAPYVVFGANGGIGEALARRLVADGHEVALVGRNQLAVEALAQELGSLAYVADMLDESSIQRACEAIVANTSGIAGMAYCIGSIVLKSVKSAARSDYETAFMLNVVGAALAVKHLASSLAKEEGAVVLFSSIAATQGFQNHAVIGSVKAGVEGLTRSLAADLAPKVRVNCIAPSLTDTPLASNLTSNETMAKAIAAMHPIARLGNAEEMASAAAFLLHPQQSWITGEVLHITGGRHSLRIKG